MLPPISSTEKPQKKVFVFPASFAQRRLWFLDQLAPGSATYNIAGGAGITGPLDVGTLEKSLQKIVERHESLRTRFISMDGEPQQAVEESVDLKMEVIGLRAAGEKERQQEIDRLAREEAQQPFDLSRAPLLRAKLLRAGEQYHVLLLTMHHIVSDGWSLEVLVREIALFYASIRSGEPPALPELPIQYGDFSVWQQDWLKGDVLKKQVDYWTKQMENVAVLDLPSDHRRPEIQSENGNQEPVELEAELVRGLRKLAWDHGATLYMVMLAAYQILLHKYAGQPDIAVGTPIAGRRRTETEGLIGFFVNTIIIRTRFQDQWSVRDLLGYVKETTLQAYDHQDAPFEKLVEVLSPQRDLSRTPLFQVMFTLQNAPFPSMRLGTAQYETFQVDGKTSKFDQSLVLMESGESIRGYLEYSTDLWEASSVASMIRRYRLVLQGMIDQPAGIISRLPILDEIERAELLEGWSGSNIANAHHGTICQKVSTWAQQQPDAAALLADGAQLTYRDLESKANLLASRLVQEGIQPQDHVGLYFDRPVDFLIAVLAVLKCGAIIVPLDAADPPARTSLILHDAAVAVVIVDRQSALRLPQTAIGITYVDSEEQPQSLDAPNRVISPESPACILYRSSPLGKPQGVVLNHRSLAAGSYVYDLSLSTSDRVAQSVSFASDMSCLNFFAVLSAGACLINIPNRPAPAPRKLSELLQQSAATVLLAPAAMLNRLAREFSRVVKNLRLLVSEDAIASTVRLLEALKPEIADRVYAAYAPVEAGGACILVPLSAIASGNRVPLRYLSAGVRIYILDTEQESVPEGVLGEIYIQREGAALAAGYLHDDGRTASTFVFAGSGRQTTTHSYRTGELACHWADGTLEFRGRSDGRVSLSGVRIEMEEIEATMRDHPVISAAAVTASGGGATGLTAWLSFAGRPVDEEELGRFVRERLPQIMVPSNFKTIADVPLTPSGAVDRLAMARKVAERERLDSSNAPYAPPRTPTEEQLTHIWAQILRADKLGIHDNFFRRGGHSLMAAQVVARMVDAFQVDIPLRRLFESPTIAEMAKVIEDLIAGKSAAAGESLPPIQRLARPVVSIPDSE